MISPLDFSHALSVLGIDFYTGVPDSLLKDLCGYLESNLSTDKFLIAANEGSALSIGIGHHLATGGVPACFLQNSGLGNIINPVTSLAHRDIYSIPCLLIIGWRGVPGVSDEPQHSVQGRITESQLDLLDIPYLIVDHNITLDQITSWLSYSLSTFKSPIALLVKKGSFSSFEYNEYNYYSDSMNREVALTSIAQLTCTSKPLTVSTTGKTSRELYEIRQKLSQPQSDFLTVGGMGHTSSIAFGVALSYPNRFVICLDGDGSLLMHMGSLAIIGSKKPPNLKYILLNNSSHESVGGQPTVASSIDFKMLINSFGISNYFSARTVPQLEDLWTNFYDSKSFAFLELQISTGSRKELGRPKSTPLVNKANFMTYS